MGSHWEPATHFAILIPCTLVEPVGHVLIDKVPLVVIHKMSLVAVNLAKKVLILVEMGHKCKQACNVKVY